MRRTQPFATLAWKIPEDEKGNYSAQTEERHVAHAATWNKLAAPKVARVVPKNIRDARRQQENKGIIAKRAQKIATKETSNRASRAATGTIQTCLRAKGTARKTQF